MEQQDCFYFYFKKGTSKKNWTLPVIDHDTVILAILNIDHSHRSDASTPNYSTEENQCVEEQDYAESTNTKKQNSQNKPDYEIAE